MFRFAGLSAISYLGIMQGIIEKKRLCSPVPRPQSLAFDGTFLWMGSIETKKLYQIDPDNWKIEQEAIVPGLPWGLAAVHGELRVICGEGQEDDRYIRAFVPGRGFTGDNSIRCPESTGSHLGFDGEHLWVSQWYNRRLVSIDEKGDVISILSIPHGICGQVIVGDYTYLLTTDDEESTDYGISRVKRSTGLTEDFAAVPFHARALAFDGTYFWTNHREQHEIVCFTLN
jgi:hypothetical protein